MAQDPVKVDPKRYKVEFENDQVRVVRIKYAPGEKSIMHGHPASVLVFLTDCHGRFTYPDGKTEEINAKAGQTMFNGPASTYLRTSATNRSRSSRSNSNTKLQKRGSSTEKKDPAKRQENPHQNQSQPRVGSFSFSNLCHENLRLSRQTIGRMLLGEGGVETEIPTRIATGTPAQQEELA